MIFMDMRTNHLGGPHKSNPNNVDPTKGQHNGREVSTGQAPGSRNLGLEPRVFDNGMTLMERLSRAFFKGLSVVFHPKSTLKMNKLLDYCTE